MARCISCSAPLPANANRCSYCNIRNDIDLHSKHKFSIQTEHSDRICPQCDTPLQTISLDIGQPFHIERCKSCYGLFFDIGELEILLENAVSNVFNINTALLENINKERFQSQQQIKYVKCPICRVLMNRVSYGHRSGVVVDQCRKHGIWLDSGEVTHLMEWKKAGGALLQAKGETKSEQKTLQSLHSNSSPKDYYSSKNKETELLESVSSLIYKLFT